MLLAAIAVVALLAMPVQADRTFTFSELKDADGVESDSGSGEGSSGSGPASVTPSQQIGLIPLPQPCQDGSAADVAPDGRTILCDTQGPGEPVTVERPRETLGLDVGALDASDGSDRGLGARPSTDRIQTAASSAANAPATPTNTWSPKLRLAALAVTAAATLLIPVTLASRKVDENEIRARIYDIVVDDPGVTASTVAEELDVHLTTAIYHLDRLREQNRVEGLRQGRTTRYFENHRKYGRFEKRLLTAFQKGTPSDLLSVVADNPGIHCAELARRLDLSRTSVKWHTDRLTEEGLLKTCRERGRLELEVPERVQPLFDEIRTEA